MSSVILRNFVKSPGLQDLIIFSIISFLISGLTDVSAQGNLLITPRRVVFEGSKRSVDLNLANLGKDTATYAISIVQIRMTEDGSFENITDPDPGQLFADRNIRFFPRSVKLGPNEAQVVKVQLIRANQLAPGEYRSHFFFRALPQKNPLGDNDIVDTSGISVVLTPVFGITIPVIIRIGESTMKTTLSDLSFNMTNDTIPSFSLAFNRTGNMSVYGDLAVYHVSPGGTATKVGIANGIAVYTPNSRRTFQMRLKNIPGIDYRSGFLRAVFSPPSDVIQDRYAEAELQLSR